MPSENGVKMRLPKLKELLSDQEFDARSDREKGLAHHSTVKEQLPAIFSLQERLRIVSDQPSDSVFGAGRHSLVPGARSLPDVFYERGAAGVFPGYVGRLFGRQPSP